MKLLRTSLRTKHFYFKSIEGIAFYLQSPFLLVLNLCFLKLIGSFSRYLNENSTLLKKHRGFYLMYENGNNNLGKRKQ